MTMQLIKRMAFALLIPSILSGCAGMVSPVTPCGPSTYRISGISAGSSSTASGGGGTADYLVAQTLGIKPVTRDQVLGARREMMNETGNVLIQKATEWCQKRNLNMVPVGAPHEDYDLPPPATCEWNTWITFVFKAVPAGQ